MTKGDSASIALTFITTINYVWTRKDLSWRAVCSSHGRLGGPVIRFAFDSIRVREADGPAPQGPGTWRLSPVQEAILWRSSLGDRQFLEQVFEVVLDEHWQAKVIWTTS